MKVIRQRFSMAPTPIAALGVASLLLAVAATLSDFVDFSRGFNPLALVEVICFGVALALLLALTLDIAPERAPWRRWVGTRWVVWARVAASVLLVALALLTFLLCIGFLNTVALQTTAHAYWNDVISFNAANAQAVLSGRNPYTDDANFLPTLIRYQQAPPTPMQGAIFGYGYNYPLQPHVFAIDKAYLRDPAAYAAAFDPATLHSYPALSFLLFIPLVALGQNILWVHLLAYAALFAWLVSLAPRGQRGWVAVAAAAAVSIPLRTLMIDTEIICLVFLLVAWHYRSRRWISAVALGLGCAFKQYCWLFAPFFVLDALLRYGWREALKRALIACAAFLAPNLPF
ncbi:MAG TPA: glycosyltransferase 87 family protein, partial [Ktedonobacterales bacterium]